MKGIATLGVVLFITQAQIARASSTYPLEPKGGFKDCGYWDYRNNLQATTFKDRNDLASRCSTNTDGKCDSIWDGTGRVCVTKSATTTKTCTCSNGKEAEGAACPNNGDSICVSCNANFYKDGNSCKTCPAGTHQTSNTFTGSSCATKVCKCTNGNGATGTTCPTHDTPFCASCNAGYRKNGNSCTACTAGNFQDQPSHTGSTCSACAKGFFAAGTAATTCTECPSGKYAASTGSFSCTDHSQPCSSSSGNKVEFTAPSSSTNRECISCGDLKNRYSNKGCAAKIPICKAKTDTECVRMKKLHKDSTCPCTTPAPAPASRR